MIEELREAIQELKRVDHLIYVSLKYTRTVDVLKNTIERMISAMDFSIAALLEHLKLKKKIKDYPSSPVQRVDMLKANFPGDTVLEGYLSLYILLRKLSKAPYTKREEYRRHVTMIAQVEPQNVVEVTIDSLEEKYKAAKDFIAYISNLSEEKKDD